MNRTLTLCCFESLIGDLRFLDGFVLYDAKDEGFTQHPTVAATITITMPSSPVLVVAGTSSGVGKTTVSCGLMAAFSSRGFTVQPFKVGPDFLDGKHHEQACACDSSSINSTTGLGRRRRRSVNLDGWMMGGKEAVLACFHRHAQGADLCIVEGVMGLHDSKDGISNDGSTAQIAKWLQAPVVLVVDAHSMARSVAAMVLGYLQFDIELRLSAVVVNNVSGVRHIEWIKDALKAQVRLVDGVTQEPLLFAGAMPTDKTVAIPERHLGLVAPAENPGSESYEDGQYMDTTYTKLAAIIQQNLDLDGLLKLAQSATPPEIPERSFSSTPPNRQSCRIGVAQDDAFSFYYGDNLKLLEDAGAKLVFFSPLQNSHLPSGLDAIYFGGGYPELHAATLERNESMRIDIRSFARAGGLIYAECGGLMFLAEALWTMTRITEETPTADRERYEMCNVLPGVVVSMTPHMKMGYADIQLAENPIFQKDSLCRGQQFHFSEVVTSDVNRSFPLLVTHQSPDAQVEKAGYTVGNVVASYFHLHWASNPSLAVDFVESAIRASPIRKMFAISFVSAATEIVFSLGAESALGGVTSVCDYPEHAQAYPRRTVCRPPFDASVMTSEEVDAAMKEQQNQSGDGPPGYWLVDTPSLTEMPSPRVVFVQETCDICDVAQSDVLFALEQCGLVADCKPVQVSPTTLEGMFQSILDVGGALGVKERSLSLCNDLRQRLDVVTAKIAALKMKKHPRVLSLEGLSPLCVGGNWLPDVKVAAGCDDALGDVGGSSARVLSWCDVQKADPDVLILSPCSATTSRTLKELHLLNSPEFWRLRCVRNGDVYVLDHSKFSRPGPRLVDGVELLATLLCGITAPDHVDTARDWKDDALKYECCVGKVKHCTTELSTRFNPCFGQGQLSTEAVTNSESNETFRRIRTTHCSLPGRPLPRDRCAHSMAALKDGSVVIFAGEDSNGARLSDIWKLHPPPTGWNSQTLDLYESLALPVRGKSAVWEFLHCDKVADENVPTNRSNSGTVICGDYFLVFGGWGVDSQCLNSCELLHLDTLCWTKCSVRGKNQPSARGNPTLVYSEQTNSAIMFGGWNKVKRLSELWVLDMTVWEWKPQVQNGQLYWPKGRTDHTSVLWTNDSGKETMLVFGGSLDVEGCSSELWMLDVASWTWQEIETPGLGPGPRTSHSAAIVGQGSSAKIVVVGGSGNGCGRSALFADAWLLSLATMTWTKLAWCGSGVARCRQTISVVGNTVLVWGGYDGDSTVSDDASVWVGSITLSNANEEANAVAPVSSERKQLQERWQAEVPVRESDLPADVVAKARASNLPGALFKALHRYAVAQQRDTYIDPASGYSVFTQGYLKRKPCCGNGCRHCPHGHINVVDTKESACDTKQLEW